MSKACLANIVERSCFSRTFRHDTNLHLRCVTSVSWLALHGRQTMKILSAVEYSQLNRTWAPPSFSRCDFMLHSTQDRQLSIAHTAAPDRPSQLSLSNSADISIPYSRGITMQHLTRTTKLEANGGTLADRHICTVALRLGVVLGFAPSDHESENI